MLTGEKIDVARLRHIAAPERPPLLLAVLPCRDQASTVRPPGPVSTSHRAMPRHGRGDRDEPEASPDLRAADRAHLDRRRESRFLWMPARCRHPGISQRSEQQVRSRTGTSRCAGPSGKPAEAPCCVSRTGGPFAPRGETRPRPRRWAARPVGTPPGRGTGPTVLCRGIVAGGPWATCPRAAPPRR